MDILHGQGKKTYKMEILKKELLRKVYLIQGKVRKTFGDEYIEEELYEMKFYVVW